MLDFDYTIGDSSDAIVECFNAGFDAVGLPRPGDRAIRRTIGIALPEAFARLAGPEHTDLTTEFWQAYHVCADRIMTAGTHLYHFTRDAMARLDARGLRLAIVSTKMRRRIEAVLTREGMVGVFDTVVGGEDVARYKPDPEGLRVAIARLGVERAETLYVGDSLVDARTAEAAGVAFVGVLTGLTTAEEFASHPHVAVLPSVVELVEWLGREGAGDVFASEP